MGKAKEAAKSLPKSQKRQVEKVAARAHRSLVRDATACKIGTESKVITPGLSGYDKVIYIKSAGGETELLGKAAVISFQQRSTRNQQQMDRANLSIELRPEDGTTIEARFDFLKNPVREMIRLAGALSLEPETPLEERVDLACDVLNQAVEAFA